MFSLWVASRISPNAWNRDQSSCTFYREAALSGGYCRRLGVNKSKFYSKVFHWFATGVVSKKKHLLTFAWDTTVIFSDTFIFIRLWTPLCRCRNWSSARLYNIYEVCKWNFTVWNRTFPVLCGAKTAWKAKGETIIGRTGTELINIICHSLQHRGCTLWFWSHRSLMGWARDQAEPAQRVTLYDIPYFKLTGIF